MTRIIAFVLAAMFVSAPLLARADNIVITFHGLEANQAARGCRITSTNKAAKSSTVVCASSEIPKTNEGFTYSETWDVPTSDTKHYGGCGVRVKLRPQTTGVPVVYDADLTGSYNFKCTMHWQTNTTLDIRYTLK